MTEALLALMAPIYEEFKVSTEWQEIMAKAYPPVELPKPVKKVKNKGTRFPGAAKTELPIHSQTDSGSNGKSDGV